jgi:hypothetical protein
MTAFIGGFTGAKANITLSGASHIRYSGRCWDFKTYRLGDVRVYLQLCLLMHAGMLQKTSAWSRYNRHYMCGTL